MKTNACGRSPLTHIERVKKPLLIAQGMQDVRVVAAESEQMVNALKGRNVPVTYITFPDEGHGFARPENRMAFFAITEAFLARHLGRGQRTLELVGSEHHADHPHILRRAPDQRTSGANQWGGSGASSARVIPTSPPPRPPRPRPRRRSPA